MKLCGCRLDSRSLENLCHSVAKLRDYVAPLEMAAKGRRSAVANKFARLRTYNGAR